MTESEIKEIKVELKGCLSNKVERLMNRLGRSKREIEEKIDEIKKNK
jgi:hypothetical protein